MTAPPGRFLEAWNAWASVILREWDSVERPEYRPFYLGSLAQHPPDGLEHAHLLVGNLSRAEVDEAVLRWPYYDVIPEKAIRKVWHRWGILHYLFAQETRPKVHAADDLSYCPNVFARYQSDNLALLQYLTARQIASTAGRRSRGPSATWRRARASKAARARWSRPRP